MKHFKITLVIGALSIIMAITHLTSAFAENNDNEIKIITVESFSDLEAYLNYGDTDTLFILDVDYTLLQPLIPAFQYGNFRNNEEFIKKTLKQVTNEQKSLFSTAIATSGEAQLIDGHAPQIIKKFKEKGTRLLALSAILSGKWKQIPDLMEWRIYNLEKANISLTDFGCNHDFKELPSYNGNYPKAKRGVLLTNGESTSKAEVLDVFLNKIKWHPKRIIFIDDTRTVIENMAAYARRNNISFIGFEYKGAKKAPCVPISKEEFEATWKQLLKEIQSAL